MQTGRGRREAVSAKHALLEYRDLSLAGASRIAILGPGGPMTHADLLAAQTPDAHPLQQKEHRLRRLLRWRFHHLFRG